MEPVASTMPLTLTSALFVWDRPACQAALRCFASMCCSMACQSAVCWLALPVCRLDINIDSSDTAAAKSLSAVFVIWPTLLKTTLRPESSAASPTLEAGQNSFESLSCGSRALTLSLLITTVLVHCGQLKGTLKKPCVLALPK